MSEEQQIGRPLIFRLIPKPRLVSGMVTLALAAMAGYFALIVASPTEITVGPVRVEFALKPAWHGKTVVEVPPAGAVEADTHKVPAIGVFSLKEITVTDIDELTDPDSPSREALENWREPVRNSALSLFLRLLIVAAAAGAAVAGVVRRSLKWGLSGAAVGLAVAMLVTGVAYSSYNTAAFSEPRYTGGIAYAPDILAFSEDTLSNLDAYEDRVPEIAESLYKTVSELHRLQPQFSEAAYTRIVHVSVMHNSSAAAGLLERVIDLYGPDFVIDTGDLTELGLPAEGRYPLSYLPLSVPYLWIAGNHDSPAIVQVMRGIPVVTVLNGEFVTLEGVKVGGFPDPASLNLSPSPVSDSLLAEEAAGILDKVDRQESKPFIVAVHDPKQAAQLAGEVPVVLNGHTHRQNITIRDGTVFLDAGTTGAGGFRGFDRGGELPSTLFVLYIQKEPLQLVAVDSLTIYGYSQEFSVQRRVFGAEEGRYRRLEAGALLLRD